MKYCAVCHTDAVRNGGLTLEHFDAAFPDPGVAAMIVSKLNGGALGASGLPMPDKAAQAAFQSAMTEAAAGAKRWVVHKGPDQATQAPTLSASIVRELPSWSNGPNPDLYRLTLTCRADTGEAEMQLAWSPDVAKDNTVLTAAVDQRAPVAYKVAGQETYGNGMAGTSGPGAVVLYTTQNAKNAGSESSSGAILPSQTLTVRNLFPNETVVFPFNELSQGVRQELSVCFAGGGVSR